MTDTEKQVDLSDVIDLSVIELYILNYLIRVAGSVVRFSVFNDINNQLQEKSISRSSFYNSLENLAAKGFVEIDSTSKGRKSAVRALPKAKLAIQQVNIFNIWGSVDPDTKFINLLAKQSDTFIEGKQSDGLMISLQYPANQEIINTILDRFERFQLLGDEATIGPIADQYELVATDEKGIVERNDQFDHVIVYRYAYNELLFSFNFETFVEEVIRITKPGGRIIFLALEDLRSTSNLILESGIGTILQETLEAQSTDRLLELLNNYSNNQNPKTITIGKPQSFDGLSRIIVDVVN